VDKARDTWFAKFKRISFSILPISKSRSGKCVDCGACCKLPNPCFFLKFKSNGKSYCSINSIKPLACRKYPRTKSEHITADTCGFRFE
jgi:Fe-S-cluster containining protein